MKFTKIIVALFATAILAGCAGKSPIPQKEGKTAVTQINMWSYKGELETTHYAVDTLIPVNSEVQIMDTSSKTITFRVVDTGMEVTLVNKQKYTGMGIDGIYDRYFGDSKVNLSKFSNLEREAIENGRVVPGMSKDAVLVARGYPPAHRTPSLESDSWRYWQSRFNTIVVNFDDGKVVNIRN
ncbi:MAG: hypothetical protein AWU57_3040 [Marinobacter sp. T13-3]|nr:MAG: hypothetical protein AWU57_3040 [Marinobacter sp. T13-3]